MTSTSISPVFEAGGLRNRESVARSATSVERPGSVSNIRSTSSNQLSQSAASYGNVQALRQLDPDHFEGSLGSDVSGLSSFSRKSESYYASAQRSDDSFESASNVSSLASPYPSIRVVKTSSSACSDGSSRRWEGSSSPPSYSHRASNTETNHTLSTISPASTSIRHGQASAPTAILVDRSSLIWRSNLCRTEVQATLSCKVSSTTNTVASSVFRPPRLTSKFPIPRLRTEYSPYTATGRAAENKDPDIVEDHLLLSAAEKYVSVNNRAQAKVIALEAAEGRARWTPAKWLLILSVLTVSSLVLTTCRL